MISLPDIQEAARLLHGRIIRTPLVYSPSFSHLTGAKVYLKLENLQETGSFKLRGASYKILMQRNQIGSKGVVAASAGNHAQGVALAARRAGLDATIVMPVSASISKQEATRNYGGKVILEGQNITESIRLAKQLSQDGMFFIHPYDDPDIITGQGTVGIEVLNDCPEPDVVLVPVGGGGLIGGIARAIKALRPQCRIVGVQAAACPSAYESLREGHLMEVDAKRSLADGIAVKKIGELPYRIIKEMVDEIVLVREEEISAAILTLIERKKVLAEGAGAVPLAALLNGSVDLFPGCTAVLVISGGNVDSPLLGRVIREGLFRSGRMTRLAVRIEDIPGTLAHLLGILAGLKANVMNITHRRSGANLPVHLSWVDLELETRGPAHIEEVMENIRAAGYEIKTVQY